MPGSATGALLFLSSWSPLLVIFGIMAFHDAQYRVAVSLAGVAIVSVLVLLGYLAVARRLAPVEIEVKHVEQKDADAMGYVATYLLPFLGIDLTKPVILIGVIILLLVIWRTYAIASLVHMNPMLAILGYRVFAIETTSDTNAMLLTRRSRIRIAEKLSVVPLAEASLLGVSP
jgi:hypothetical protein